MFNVILTEMINNERMLPDYCGEDEEKQMQVAPYQTLLQCQVEPFLHHQMSQQQQLHHLLHQTYLLQVQSKDHLHIQLVISMIN